MNKSMMINVYSYPIILDHVSNYEGGFCMDLELDHYMNTYDDPYPLSTMLLDDNMSCQDIQTLISHDHFPVLDHHHQSNIDITTTEYVQVCFKDYVPNLVVAEEPIYKKVMEDSIVPEFNTPEEDVSLTYTTSIDMESSTMDITSSSSSSLVFPTEGMDMNDELVVFHLLTAYAEAMEMGQEELAAVIAKRISEKVSPVGDSTIERLMYHMFKNPDNKQQPDYLRQESLKNFHQAFKAFYQIFPHGKLAHFASNLAILESLAKEDFNIIRIFDFDIGEGIQWACLIEAIGPHNHGGRLEMRLTSVKFEANEMEEENEEEEMWKFEDTKKRLRDCAKSYGLKLEVDEMEWDDDDGVRNMDPASSSRKEFYVFNCMVGLPHMGRVRRRRDVFNFLQSSHDFLGGNVNGNHGYHNSKKGIVTFGDGEAWEKVNNTCNYASYLTENMSHYQALMESIQQNFPSHLVDARTAMECLFVAPFVSCKRWAEKWEERKKYGGQDLVPSSRIGGLIEGLSLSKESLLEAKEVVREGKGLYEVRVDGESENEMIMEWRGIPMVKVSCCKST